jgi:hypothetical protein
MTQAVAADYADAMLVGRRAKNAVFLFLTLILLVQLGAFFVARYVPSVKIKPDVTSASVETGVAKLWSPTLRHVVALSDFGGIILSMVLPVVLLLIVAIMLVGRLVGVSHVTSSFVWSIVLMLLLFPWQTLLNSESRYEPAVAAGTTMERPDVTLPGVLYTYPELSRHYDFSTADFKSNWSEISLKWMRFVGWPVVALIILLMIHGRSSRGLKFALGEAELPVETAASTV